MTLPDILQAITIWKTAAARLIANLRNLAATTTIEDVRIRATQLANDIEAFVNSNGDLNTLTMDALKELEALVLSGKSIVTHQATDIQ